MCSAYRNAESGTASGELRHRGLRTPAWVAAAFVVLLVAGSSRIAMAAGGGGTSSIDQSRALLPLVKEKVRGGDAKGGKQVNFWWSTSTDPAWTETDRALQASLEQQGVELVTPDDETQLSRVYRRPDLSVENTAALASVMGASRVLAGTVEYRPMELGAPGIYGSRAEAQLQILDVGAAEPEVLRSFDVHRSGWGASTESARSAARESITNGLGALIGRVVSAASGPVGVETDESHLLFHAVQRERALEMVEKALEELEIVDEVRPAWMAEGLVAVEINPETRDSWDRVDRAAEQLATHQFEGLELERRSRERQPAIEFDVTLDRSFDSEEAGRRNRGDE